MHNKRTYAMLACAVMTWLAMPVFAADADTTITTRDVNVEANRAKEEAKYESQSMTIITKEDIEKKQAKSLEDVIFSETGVTRTVDAMGRVGVAIRGADPRHTLMLIDGQPVMGSESKYMGGSDEAMRIGAENIERIEIIRGAATAKYGPDAIGGVINIITKAPSDHPTFQLNAEARYHDHEGTDENKNTWPTNFYMRADTGKVGNAKFSIFGSKREIMPVYSSERAYNKSNSGWYDNFRPSLRYYGDVKTIGGTGEIELNENNKITFRVMNEKEDLQRRNKSAGAGLDAFGEAMQIFKRDMSRDTYALSYTGKNDKHDWKLDINYGKMKENDTTLTSYYASGHDQFSGQNTLAGVDWLEHKQLDISATMNTQVNDKHLLTYGIGYTDERAEGTRLRNAPKKWTKGIDPWDYDKSLWVPIGETTPDSNVHNWDMEVKNGQLLWNKNQEYYGTDNPIITYEDASEWYNGIGTDTIYYNRRGKPRAISVYDSYMNGEEAFKENLQFSLANHKITQEQYDKYLQAGATLGKKFDEFGKHLQDNLSDNDKDHLGYLASSSNALAQIYFGLQNYGSDEYQQYIKYNGLKFKEEFENRKNQVAGGEARIQRKHAFIQDTWQINDDTIFTPALRIDHSDKFGTHATVNLGVTHNLNGNAHRRLKINAGTGYAEPGIGELYYNWEMFGSAGGTQLGWYWLGNPDLKPEKSVNFDISLEGENNKTYAKASIFHNTIDDYMTAYFMGQLIDFNQLGSSYVLNADRIYSFKNIGKAEITGFEAEVQQRFNDKWSAKLGYAWLHAINKSDPDMPRTLLDRPQHKIDISFNYEDKKHGWKAALWGDYYIHMLDSNSVNTAKLFKQDEFGNYVQGKADYKKKTFGIWNFIVEKQVNPDATIYMGIDNLFNHRDDDRAYADRTYRIGANIKFGYDAKSAAEKAAKKAAANAQGTAEPSAVDTTADNGTVIMNQGDWFLTRPSDKDAARKQGDVKLIGDYRVRSNMFGGQDNAAMSLTRTAIADDGATKNLQDAPNHGLEQRLRLGVDAQLGDNTNLLVEGSSGNTIDTKYSKADKRGLHDTRLERAELNQKANKWDFTIGRLTEKMGVTGYWFGKEYDGVRATWTGDKTQVRIGYGDFSKSTGITDSAYTHNEKAVFYRSPSVSELLGIQMTDTGLRYELPMSWPDDLKDAYKSLDIDYMAKFNHAGDGLTSPTAIADAKLKVLQELNQKLQQVNQTYYTDFSDANGANGFHAGKWYDDSFLTSTDTRYSGTKADAGQRQIDIPVDGATETIFESWIRKDDNIKDITWGEILDTTSDNEYGTVGKRNIYTYLGSVYDAVETYYKGTGKTPFANMSKEDALDALYVQFAGKRMYSPADKESIDNMHSTLGHFYQHLLSDGNYNPTSTADIPVSALAAAMKVEGTLLKQDIVPAIDRAAFIQVRQKLNDNLGLIAWYLRSSGEAFHKTGIVETNGTWDTYSQDMNVANVFGLGAQWKLGASRLSFDWGVNRSETGRYFNGGRDAYGRYTGGGPNPTFWVLRADIGHADTDQPGSWNAFADYKYFQHGAFFGGNGTEALPDRYLDGIRSFTLGAGYVPAKNLLLEAFYTFGAKSTGQRDTLYGPESFTLGDYTRVQVSYKF